MQAFAFCISLLALSLLNPSPNNPVTKEFEGSITFTIEYLEVPEEIRGMESMLPQTLHMYFKGKKAKVEQEVMGGSQIVLVDNEKNESHILMDMMGQKIDIYLDSEAMKQAEQEAQLPVIKELEGKKRILGYPCKKASITDVETGKVQIVYYTKKIDIKHKDFKALDGFPLEYLAESDGLKMKVLASAVNETELSPSVFEVPDGYQQMTMEEMNQMFGSE